MRILMITSDRLGDAFLSTGILDHFVKRHPGAEVHVLCGKVPAALFRNAPRLASIRVIEKQPYALHWLKAYLDLVRSRWDLVLNLRNVGIMRLLPAKKNLLGGVATGQRHRLEDFQRLLDLPHPPAPQVWLDSAAKDNAANLIPDGAPVLALAPSTGPKRKLWRPDRYAAVVKALIAPGGAMAGARVAVLASPAERERNQAEAVLSLLPQGQTINLVGKTDPLDAAACLARCDGFIGVDSGLMHLAAAVDIPTLGLFGELGVPQVYRPWGRHTAYIHRRNPSYESQLLPNGEVDRPAAMDGITVAEVINAAKELLRRAGSAVAEAP